MVATLLERLTVQSAELACLHTVKTELSTLGAALAAAESRVEKGQLDLERVQTEAAVQQAANDRQRLVTQQTAKDLHSMFLRSVLHRWR